MDNKAQIESILKQRFFVTPTGYPSQNGFLDYGPPLSQIKLQIIDEFRKIFVDENTYEMEPSAVVPYEVLKNSGHVDKFCDIVLSDGSSVVRADHFIEEMVGEFLEIPTGVDQNFAAIAEETQKLKEAIFAERKPKNVKKKAAGTLTTEIIGLTVGAPICTEQLSASEVKSILSKFECVTKNVADLTKCEIDIVVILHNLHSAEGKPFNPSKDFNLIFKLNERQFLRPEIAQSQFTNFRRLFDLNNEKLPFSSLAIGRSYRNEISARGGMLRTKEFEQAEIEYFSEDGSHSGYCDIKGTRVLLYPSASMEAFEISIGEAHDKGIIASSAICYFIAKAQEFLVGIGFRPETLRFRQHKPNEMAHYAKDCWDAEIKTLSGWVECAGIADRGTHDLSCHASNVNTQARKHIQPKKVYELVPDMRAIGKQLRSKAKEFEAAVKRLTQADIKKSMKDGYLEFVFEESKYSLAVSEKTVDSEFFIPRVIEPSFGISRILYSLVEQSFNIRDERNVLSLKPKMCFAHCCITYLKYFDCFADILAEMKKEMRANSIRFRVNDRSCSIGRKYSSCDEIGIPYFITLDVDTPKDGCVTIRDRDSTTQVRVQTKEVSEIVKRLIDESLSWEDLYAKYKYVH